MFDIWFGDVEITTVVLIVSVLLLLPTQLLLCFKVRNLLIRLLPAIELAVPTLVFTILYFISTGWDRIGYLFLMPSRHPFNTSLYQDLLTVDEQLSFFNT